MFTFADSANCQMPAPFGEREGQQSPQMYCDVTTVDDETDAEALSTFLPGCFELLQPVLTNAYAMNRRAMRVPDGVEAGRHPADVHSGPREATLGGRAR
jgi:hypothetical protein